MKFGRVLFFLPNDLRSLFFLRGGYLLAVLCAACLSCSMASAVDDVVDQAAESLGGEDVADKLKQHGEAFTGFLGDVQATLLSQLNAQSVGPEGFVENFQGEREWMTIKTGIERTVSCISEQPIPRDVALRI